MNTFTIFETLPLRFFKTKNIVHIIFFMYHCELGVYQYRDVPLPLFSAFFSWKFFCWFFLILFILTLHTILQTAFEKEYHSCLKFCLRTIRQTRTCHQMKAQYYFSTDVLLLIYDIVRQFFYLAAILPRLV